MFKNKYKKYKTKYLNLQQKGGNMCTIPSDTKLPMQLSITSYLKNKETNLNNRKKALQILLENIPCTSHITRDKYFVILYGPPASGKTISRKIGLLKLVKNYGENLENIEKTFIDTSIDDIAYNTVGADGKGPKIIEKLKENIDKRLKSYITIEEKMEYVKKNLTEIVKTSFEIYSRGRDNTLSELLMHYGFFLGKNIFLEISTGNVKYIQSLIQRCRWYGYKIISVYPFISDVNILFDRSIRRGIKEGRFLSCGDLHGLYSKATSCKNALSFLDNNLDGTFIYDANFDQDIYEKINTIFENDYDYDPKSTKVLNDIKMMTINDVNKITIEKCTNTISVSHEEEKQY